VGDGPGPRGVDLASQVAELQQAVNEATIRVVDRIKLREAISELQQIIKRQQKAEAAATMDVVADKVAELLQAAPKIGQTTVVVSEMPDLPIDQLKTAADMIKQKCKSAAVLFGVRVAATERPFGDAQGRLRDEATKPAAGEAAPTSERGAPATDVASAPRGGRGVRESTAQEAVAHPPEPGAPATESEPRRVSERTESEAEAPARAPGKALLLAAMSNDLVKRGVKAGDLIKHVAPLIDGRGGGPPTMAQAGGKDPERIPDALAAGQEWIEQRLG
jgi:alanyl-tRNA synthetase